MRLIDADALIPIMKYTTTDNEIGVFPIRIGFEAIKGVIDEAPTIDAVEIVHCEDCKWDRTPECPMAETTGEDIAGSIEIGVGDCYNEPDDYCSYGERKLKNPDDSLVTEDSEGCKEQKSKLKSKQIREYIPKDEVLDIIKSMPMDLVEEYVYMTKGIWLDDDEEKHQLSPETSTNSKDICEQIKKHAERIKAESDKNPDSLWAKGMRSFDVLDDSTTSKTETVDTPTNTPTDLISRQAAIDAVEKALFKRVAKAFIESLPPVEPKPVCEDCISRQDTVNALCRECGLETKCGGADCHENWCTEVVVIMNMPPVEPKRLPQPHKCVVYRDGECRYPIEACSECPKHEGMRAVLAERPKGEWVSCSEPPEDRRNVFLAHGTNDFKSCCIGHYEQGMGWYEDRNFFAKPIYDCKYWCDIPDLPDMGDNQFDMRGDKE